jgi:hypothetical protein
MNLPGRCDPIQRRFKKKKEQFRRLLRCSVLAPLPLPKRRNGAASSAPPLPLPNKGKGEKGLGGEEIRTVVEDEAGEERRLSGRGTLMG